MGQAQTPVAAATNVYTPGTFLTDQVIALGTGSNTFSGPVAASAGVLGSKAWLYQYLEPASSKASSVDGRMSSSGTSTVATTGTIVAFAIPIESGVTVANLTLTSIAAEATGTHAWVGLADNTGKVLAVSADNTGAAYFAANTVTTTAFAASYTTTYTGLYYGFVNVTAGTVPTFAAAPAFAHVAISTVPPIVCGTALTGQTTPVAVGSSLGTITPTANHQLYAYLT